MVRCRALVPFVPLVLAGSAALALAQQDKDFSKVEIKATKVAGNIYMLEGAGGNIAASVGDDGIAIVDDQFAPLADKIRAALKALGITEKPVRFVINTHYHTDHIGENARYHAKGAILCAQANVAVQAAKDTTIPEWGQWHRRPAPAAGLPTLSFGDSLRLRWNGETIVMWHAPAAHTDGDAILWLPGRNLIHAGDIVEVGATPFIDWWAGGTLDGMIVAVDRIMALADAKTVIVPGHGETVNRAWLESYRDMLVTGRTRARAAIAAGQSRTDFIATRPFAEWEARLGGERQARALASLIYYGLNGMKL